MSFIVDHVQSLFATVGPFFILLGILIFVHELGHFMVAKFFGVRVEVFSMGMGKKILTYKRGDTNYCLSMIPIGGYVKMYGDDPSAEVPADQKRYAFLCKPIPQRFAIVLAGPLMNLFFAIFIFSFIIGIGEDVAGPFVGDVPVDTKAFTAGLHSGDKILSLDGETVATWSQVQHGIEAAGGKTLDVEVERKGMAAPLHLQVPVGLGENENIFSSDRQVGLISGLSQESRSTMIGVRDPQSPAALAGVPSLMLLTTVNGQKVQFWRELNDILKSVIKPGDTTLTLQVRDVEKPDKPENQQSYTLNLPKNLLGNRDVVAALGLEPAELYIYQVSKNSPAARGGILAKDKVLRVGGEPVASWSDVLAKVKSFDPNQELLDFTIAREGAEKTFKVRPEMTTLMNAKGQEEHRFTIGIVSGFFPVGADPVFYRITNPLKVVQHGFNETVYWTEFVVMSMVRLIQGEVSAKNIGGVIMIGRVASHSFAAGLSTFLRMMGLISINLFLLNLLPIPILDGGHLVFYSIEALRGAPLSMRKMEIAQQVGLMLLMFLMAFAFFNDITNLFSGRW